MPKTFRPKVLTESVGQVFLSKPDVEFRAGGWN